MWRGHGMVRWNRSRHLIPAFVHEGAAHIRKGRWMVPWSRYSRSCQGDRSGSWYDRQMESIKYQVPSTSSVGGLQLQLPKERRLLLLFARILARIKVGIAWVRGYLPYWQNSRQQTQIADCPIRLTTCQALLHPTQSRAQSGTIAVASPMALAHHAGPPPTLERESKRPRHETHLLPLLTVPCNLPACHQPSFSPC